MPADSACFHVVLEMAESTDTGRNSNNFSRENSLVCNGEL
jgi:hypothetical protein